MQLPPSKHKPVNLTQNDCSTESFRLRDGIQSRWRQARRSKPNVGLAIDLALSYGFNCMVPAKSESGNLLKPLIIRKNQGKSRLIKG